MTVDSRYAIAQYDEDGEVTYRFFTESIGDEAMQVWQVAPDGVRTQLAPTLYTITYDLSQTPTFIGGTITLVTPLADGFKLSVERKTPIVNDLILESGKRFPSEEFEYMMDKICFIQQEIEGSYCDCRDSGGDIPVPPNVCKVYECDIMQKTAEVYGADYWPLLEKNVKAGPVFGNPLISAATWNNPQGFNEAHYEWDGTAGMGIYNLGWDATTTWAQATAQDTETTALASVDINPCVDPISPEGHYFDNGGLSVIYYMHYSRNANDYGYNTTDSGKRYGRGSLSSSGVYYRFNQTSSTINNAVVVLRTVQSNGNTTQGSFNFAVTRWNQTQGPITAGDLRITAGTQAVLATIPNTPGAFDNTPVFIGVILDTDYDNRIHVRDSGNDDSGRAAFECFLPYTGYVRVADYDGTFDTSLNFSGQLSLGITYGEAGSASNPTYVLPVSNYAVLREDFAAFGSEYQFGVHSLASYQSGTPINAIDEMVDAWRQNMEDYVDPDPTCTPLCKVYSCSAYETAIGGISNIDYWSMNDQTGTTMAPDVGNWSLYWGSFYQPGGFDPTPDQPTLYASCGDGGGAVFDPPRSFRCETNSGFVDRGGAAVSNMSSDTCAWGGIFQPIETGDNSIVLYYFNWATIDECALWVYLDNGTDIRVRLQRTGGGDPNSSQTIAGVTTLGQSANLAFTLDWSTANPVVVVYKDFVAVGTLTFTNKGTWFTNPARRFNICNTDEGGTGATYVQSAWWLDRKLVTADLNALKEGWDQNQTDYKDPDPFCYPNNQEPVPVCNSLGAFWNEEKPSFLWRYLQGGPVPSAGDNDTIIGDYGNVDLTIPSASYSENTPEGTPIIGNCEGYNWRCSAPGQNHQIDVGSGTTIGAQDFDLTGYTVGYIRAGSNSQGVVNGLTFTEKSIDGATQFNPNKGLTTDSTDIKFQGSPTRVWSGVLTDTATRSIILVYRRDQTVPDTVYDPDNNSSELELFIDGVSQGVQGCQTYPACTGMSHYIRVFCDNDAGFQDMFIDGRPWTQTDIDRHQAAYEANK